MVDRHEVGQHPLMGALAFEADRAVRQQAEPEIGERRGDLFRVGQPVTDMLAAAQASKFVNGFVVMALARAILLEASGPKYV